jgi:hypothetical protein
MIRKAVALLVAVTAMSLAVANASSAKPPRSGETISLRVGKPVFWDGPFIEQAGLPAPAGVVGNPALCDVDPERCVSFPIDVLESADLLRVGIDYPYGLDAFFLHLADPSGEVVVSEPAETWDYEALVDDPAVGRWRAIVEFADVTNTWFRMRALLTDVPDEPEVPQDLVPNLRMTPPHQFTWTCDPRETILYGVESCLRFSAGPENVGDGPLFLHMKEPGVKGTMLQKIMRSDGTSFTRDAGNYEFHAIHGHYHQIGVGEWELLKVTDPKRGGLVSIGDGRKQGFCTGDAVIADWESFEVDPPRRINGAVAECTGVEDANGAVMGLGRGWADIYYMTTEGNYVNFAGNGDGDYVVRAKTDILDSILETDEGDNVSYALIRVEGSTITVLERGYGTDPWDPKKELSTDIRELLG